MIVSENDAVWAADEFIDYFKNFTSIEDYLRYAKKEALGKRLGSLDSLMQTSSLMRTCIQRTWIQDCSCW